MKSLFSFKTKVISLKSLSFPQCRHKSKFRLSKLRPAISSEVQKPVSKVRIAELLTVLFSLRKLPKEVDRDSSVQVNNVTSVDVFETGHDNEPFSSPTTPKKDSSDDLEEVKDSSMSFESYLVEMIVGEGKLKELIDVEELLYCWRNLKSPIFVDLVCMFYEEVCKDLFSPSEVNESHATTISQ